jgi:MoxR-like ATPase
MKARIHWPKSRETALSREGATFTHLFEHDDVVALNASLVARRPLLVRGEPGTGKSQLAEAAAAALGWEFVSKTIDATTEARDLLWTYDAVGRLAEAQLAGAAREVQAATLSERLDPRNFVEPGPIWFGFDWLDACRQSTRAWARAPAHDELEAAPTGGGVVVLIDEIDKADPSVPNGLLEAFGRERFERPFATGTVSRADHGLLVIITSNEERSLPVAFLRRCLVRELKLPTGDGLIAYLVERGRAHFRAADGRVLEHAARMLAEDRKGDGPERPGQAEYLDLLRAVIEDDPTQPPEDQLAQLESIRRFVYQKSIRV